MSNNHFTLRPSVLLLSVAAISQAGCVDDILGPDPRVAKANEAKAVGSACRYAMRGIEDCYTLNPKAAKSQVFAGWKEMDEYMREHNVEGTTSVFTQKPPVTRSIRGNGDDIETEYPDPRS